MRHTLAADIGGTKTLLLLSTEQGEPVLEQEFPSQKFARFDLMLSEFLNQGQNTKHTIDSACFAVAGPVLGRKAKVTNLPWQLNADDLEKTFDIHHV
ncbi:MAG: glucokinase, partial [Gammaproteobacteria bacterium]|nr:glucokinase [Gammaproteobacteria bacterium]